MIKKIFEAGDFYAILLDIVDIINNNPIYGLIELSWWLHKGKTIVYRSYVIGHKFINPIDECGV